MPPPSTRPSRSAIVWMVVGALWVLPVMTGVVPVGTAARQLVVWLVIVVLIVVSHELAHVALRLRADNVLIEPAIAELDRARED